MAILGVDIGGTQIKAGLVSAEGELLKQGRIATPATLEVFAREFPALVRSLGAGSLEGVGIGCKGVIHPETTRVEVLPGTVHYLEGLHLRDFLPQAPVVVADNDARVALAGEMAWGAARGKQHVLMLTLGTGVGGGIVANGKMLRGHSGVAGHLGHYTIDVRGPLCICGNRGCLETYFSSKAMESEAAAMLHRGLATAMRAPLTCERIFEHAREGDPAARSIIANAVEKLAGAVAGLLLALDPEILILGGQIAQAGEILLDPLKAQIRERTFAMLRREVPIVPTRIADGTGLLGAAALVKVVQG